MQETIERAPNNRAPALILNRESKESYLRPLFFDDPRAPDRPFPPADFLDEPPRRCEEREVDPPRFVVFFLAPPELRLLLADEDFRPPDDLRAEDFFATALDFFADPRDEELLFLADVPLLGLRDPPADVDRDDPPLFAALFPPDELENFVPADAPEDLVLPDRAELLESLLPDERGLDAPSDDWFDAEPVAS